MLLGKVPDTFIFFLNILLMLPMKWLLNQEAGLLKTRIIILEVRKQIFEYVKFIERAGRL